MQELFNFIERYVRLEEKTKMEIERLAEIEYFKKNDHILSQGQHCYKIWFLKKGMVRKYHLYNGKEITSWVHTEDDIFTSLQSYAQDSLTSEYLQALEDVEVISITRSNSEKLALYPEMMNFTNLMMGQEFAKIDIHSKALGQLDAKGKYEYFCSIAPEVVKRAKLGHIASIIGVSQETLSRIRKS